MIRKIVDFKKLSEEVLSLLVEKYPDGYSDHNIISFKNQKGEIIKAVEIKSADIIYLVKISTQLVRAMENFVDDDEDDEINDIIDLNEDIEDLL
ncbi:MAG: hypothetical protein O3C01_01995 [Bacteroidetes bacterium]|jgi:DNA-directed RNA polymerase subunit delta|nr:MAG: hypothetical protein ABR90_06220 [Cryomorphaceae bacterium BACL29 MAG-121220-bin8]MDA0757424.1 hypothetical protein [Bacteroidota bacterium]MDA1019856.1 hypothetical protein [Bacteroidota bacterium]|tara:strand:+ start:4468 stop:4749 length:282 start_codon:yes stop_codon:yes gene_type:complete